MVRRKSRIEESEVNKRNSELGKRSLKVDLEKRKLAHGEVY